MVSEGKNMNKITIDEVVKNWGRVNLFGHEAYLSFLVDILNKDYLLETAIEDIKSFRKVTDES